MYIARVLKNYGNNMKGRCSWLDSSTSIVLNVVLTVDFLRSKTCQENTASCDSHDFVIIVIIVVMISWDRLSSILSSMLFVCSRPRKIGCFFVRVWIQITKKKKKQKNYSFSCAMQNTSFQKRKNTFSFLETRIFFFAYRNYRYSVTNTSLFWIFKKISSKAGYIVGPDRTSHRPSKFPICSGLEQIRQIW